MLNDITKDYLSSIPSKKVQNSKHYNEASEHINICSGENYPIISIYNHLLQYYYHIKNIAEKKYPTKCKSKII